MMREGKTSNMETMSIMKKKNEFLLLLRYADAVVCFFCSFAFRSNVVTLALFHTGSMYQSRAQEMKLFKKKIGIRKMKIK